MSHQLFPMIVVFEIITFGVTAGLFYFLPLWSHHTVYFSVTVLPEFRDSPEAKRILTRYQLEAIAHSLIGFAVFLGGLKFQIRTTGLLLTWAGSITYTEMRLYSGLSHYCPSETNSTHPHPIELHMALRITKVQANAIGDHGAREYPNECCGAMLGVEIGGVKEVRELAALKNIRQDFARGQELIPLTALETESERNRFLIDPKDLVQVEKQARSKGLDIIGFYHSHPDHPARPSAYDRDHAFPWYSYVIITVEAGKPGPYTSWVLREDRSQFDGEEISLAGRESRAEELAQGT